MRCCVILAVGLLLAGCAAEQASRACGPAATCVGGSRPGFCETYAEWRRELLHPANPDSWVWPDEMIESLGRQAHQHVDFLLGELEEHAEVHMILDASEVLCERYGIRPPKRSPAGWVVFPEERQKIWLDALRKAQSEK